MDKVDLLAQQMSKIDLMIQKLDQVLALNNRASIAQSPSKPYLDPSPSFQEVCNLCASPTHHVSECPTTAQFSPFIQEQVQAAQGYSKPNFDPYSNTYNPG